MPRLTDAEVTALKATPMEICPECGRKLRKNYCRDCRQFFWLGHLNDCPRLQPSNDPATDDHRGHRTY
jgi:hypothetical protein